RDWSSDVCSSDLLARSRDVVVVDDEEAAFADHVDPSGRARWKSEEVRARIDRRLDRVERRGPGRVLGSRLKVVRVDHVAEGRMARLDLRRAERGPEEVQVVQEDRRRLDRGVPRVRDEELEEAVPGRELEDRPDHLTRRLEGP